MTTQAATIPAPTTAHFIIQTCPAITVRRGYPKECGAVAVEDGRCAEHAARKREIGR